MMTSFEHLSKYNQKPFSFRWGIEHLLKRLRSVGDHFASPSFELAPGVQMYVNVFRKKFDGEEWLSVYLYLSPKSRLKEATLDGFSIVLLRSPPKKGHRFEVKQIKYFNADNNIFGWGLEKFFRFDTLKNPNQGFLKDGHQLTVLVEGNVFHGEQPNNPWEIDLIPKKSFDDLAISIHKQTIQNYRKLFDEGLLSDFVVKAKDANGVWKELKVHRNILAVGSKIFGAMLSNPELKECREGVLEIEDVRFEVMETLIRFLYTGELTLGENAVEGTDELALLVAADKYAIEEIKTLVEHRLAASLSVENVCGRLANADHYKAPFLKERCIEFIRQRRNEVADTDDLQQLCAEFPHLMGDLLKER